MGYPVDIKTANIVTAGTTAVYRQIKDYVGATVTATTNTTTTAITTTETCIVYTATNVHTFGATGATGKTTGQLTWEQILSTVEIPYVIAMNTLYRYAADYGTASAADATTATLAATAGAGALPTRANDVYNGMYIYIYSATTNAGSWAGISDYVQSTKVATLDSTGWVGGTPATSIVYRIMPNTSELFFDNYVQLFMETYFADLTSSSQEADFKKLIDKSNKITATSPPISLDQDLALFAEYIVKGKAIFDYSNL